VSIKLHFTDVFDVNPGDLEDYGAFNISLINDLPCFIDPFLLFNSEDETYKQLHDHIITYVRFLKDRSIKGTINEGLLRSWFMFPEVRQNWFGYSLVGNSGSGLGIDFARALYHNLRTVFSNFGAEQISRASHLEKLCLIKDGVGRDNISDFTTNLIKGFLLEYTQKFAQQFIAPKDRRIVLVERVRFNYNTYTWEYGKYDLPYYKKDYAILTPKNILTKDETWINKADMIREFDDIANSIPNIELRAQIDDYFRRMIPTEAKQEDLKKAMSEVISRYPEFIDYYIRYKEENGGEAVSVSSQRVKEVEQIFIQHLRAFVVKLIETTGFYNTIGDTYQEAQDRVLFLKDVIENKGGHKLFFINGKPIRRESDLQILFRLTWFATPSDVSKEVNDGRGPVDFKISRGAKDKSLVEFKLAKNTQLKRNLARQTPIYEKASDAGRSIKVILYFSDEEYQRVHSILKELDLIQDPDIVLIDGSQTNKPSGSKA
jgi:hypothetical protein